MIVNSRKPCKGASTITFDGTSDGYRPYRANVSRIMFHRALPYANAIAPMGRNTIKIIVTKNNYDR
jgi:hypothetical protein